MHAPCLQFLYIFPGCFRGPHTGVHRGCDQYRSLCGQYRRGKHVVCNTGRHLGNDICGCRSDDKHLCQFGQGHIFHIPVLRRLESIRNHLVGRKRLKSKRRNKFRRVLCHDHMYIRAQMTQTGDNLCAFVRGDASRHSQHDLPAGQIHISSAPPAPSGCRRSAVRG